jgi:hypothetical protein
MEWTPEEEAVLSELSSPERIQAFLDATPYSTDPVYRCPRSVLRDRRAHCFDGALLAAAALRRRGEPALIVDLRAVRDDDHVITIFRRRGRVGAVAKSNVVGLRYREPIYRDLRELVMSYFEFYYNLDGEKTLRSYSIPLDLKQYDRLSWTTVDGVMDAIAKRLDARRHVPLLTPAMIRGLSRMDQRTFDAGLAGANNDGLYGYDPATRAKAQRA